MIIELVFDELYMGGKICDPPHTRSETVLHKNRRGRFVIIIWGQFVIHNIWELVP